ncbi:MAG: methionyl-tRNA formyltransferase [Colwellia sp.]|nr:methionyl-tRNA formyltransferase [Colwellia sp.]NQZ80640.1 methionyl-tRNA formyltransferase [Colwellia sp.]
MFKTISVLVDNKSWILPFAERLVEELKNKQYTSKLIRRAEDIPHGDVCFLLGCTKIISNEILQRNTYNMVVHESDLPSGKGFAPIAWQILEAKKTIPVCLLEANSDVDSGKVWLKSNIKLEGNELSVHWRKKQGEISIKLALKFISQFSKLKPTIQQGRSSYYSKRTAKDSELDINKTIAEQFELLRIVDNKHYPAFFDHRGSRYKIEITRDD